MPADWLYFFFGLLLFVANVTAWMGTLYRLPGNWIIVANCTLYMSFFPAQESGPGFGWFLVALLLMLAALGDSLTFAVKRFRFLSPPEQVPGIQRILFGAGGGSLAGALLGLWVPVVGTLLAIVGAVGGAAGGAYVGTLLAVRKKPPPSGSVRVGRLGAFRISEESVRRIPRLVVGGLMILLAASATILR